MMKSSVIPGTVVMLRDTLIGSMMLLWTYSKIRDMISREVVVEYAKKHHVCPFEFSLDISLWADVIICDYNYVFDPQVYLKRFFDGIGNDYVFLIDEAHNLVDRSREMFSAQINKADFLDLRDIFKDKYPSLYKAMNKCNRILNDLKKEVGEITTIKEEIRFILSH